MMPDAKTMVSDVRLLVLLTAAALVVGPSITSKSAAQPVRDPVRTFDYSPDVAQQIDVAPGYATLLEFSSAEAVDNVIVGDSSAWQVTPTKRGDHVVIKPLRGGAQTNLIVTTNLRRYLFLLQPGSGGALVYGFRYPVPEAASPETEVPQTRYRFSGQRSLFPQAMYADGERTHITWGPGVPIPAVFAIDQAGTESLVNGRMEKDAYVLEAVAPKYVFRRGRQTAIARVRKQDARR